MAEKTKTVSLRMPLTLLKKIAAAADRERRSLTAEILLRLERGENDNA